MANTGARCRALARVWFNPSLRRLCLAFLAFNVAELAVWVTLAAYAFQIGGVDESAAVIVAQLVPATLFALTVGSWIHRFGAARVLRTGYLLQTVGMAGAAIVLAAHGPSLAVYLGAMLAATTVTIGRPCQAVMAPTLVDGPAELTAVNVIGGLLEGTAGLVGPAIAAVGMTLVGPQLVFALMAAATAASTMLVWTLPGGRPADVDGEASSVVAGMRAVAATPGPRLLVVALGVHAVLWGAVDLLAVVIAVDLLRRPEAFAGWVTTSFGVGMVAAGLIAVVVVGRERLAGGIVGSAMAAGISLALVSVAGDRVAVVLGLIAVCGTATALYELTSRMLLQRVSRLDVLGHAFSLVEAMQMAMLAVGSASVPFVVRWLGPEEAPAAIGALMVVTAALLAFAVVRVDRTARVPITEMAALRSCGLFGSLPAPALETLAREARRLEVAAGGVVVREGDEGDDYYVVVAGRLDVLAAGRSVSELGRTAGFGEVALLHECRRIATVRALEDSVLLAVDREPFLVAVTSHVPTLDGANAIARRWREPTTA